MSRPSHIPADAVAIPLHGKHGRGKVAWVSPGDAERVSAHKWFVSVARSGTRIYYYASCTIDGRLALMHRFILHTPKGMHTDHKDHDTLNNTRQNIRSCTVAENMGNRRGRSGTAVPYKGVTIEHGRYRAQLRTGDTTHTIGTFASPDTAALAYDAVHRLFAGEFACPNFPGVDPTRLLPETVSPATSRRIERTLRYHRAVARRHAALSALRAGDSLRFIQSRYGVKPGRLFRYAVNAGLAIESSGRGASPVVLAMLMERRWRMAEIARHVGITRERVRQIRNQALVRIGQPRHS